MIPGYQPTYIFMCELVDIWLSRLFVEYSADLLVILIVKLSTITLFSGEVLPLFVRFVWVPSHADNSKPTWHLRFVLHSGSEVEIPYAVS